jgi:glutamyl-Q tRNA(Asp) synthetase
LSYIGRFAPSPTGDLHLGSLLAAVGSYLEARRHHGRWLLRIEDLDAARTVPGALARILAALEAHGFEWYGAPRLQSVDLDGYQAGLDQLSRAGRLFRCACSRRAIHDAGLAAEPRCVGNCRNRQSNIGSGALRFDLGPELRASCCRFIDELQGEQNLPADDYQDVVVRRRDGTFSYQLAVVVDDHRDAITDVVRGGDLLTSTPWQLALAAALSQPSPRYGHLPVVVEPDGRKLAKSRHTVAIDAARVGPNLHAVLQLLRQSPPAELALWPAPQIWSWAAANWTPSKLRGVQHVAAVA